MSTATWFAVDKSGLAQLMAGRDKSFVLYELLQNAWDQNVSRVNVTIEKIQQQRATVRITVEDDDPEGFADLAHAYTLFASSVKKADATKRGRFNLGEKLVLAMATKATISTTKGTVEFDATGRRDSRRKRDAGSCVTAEFSMNATEYRELMEAAFRVIAPRGITTMLNGQQLPEREPVAQFEIALPTLVADDDGTMRSSIRKTIVRVYEPARDETPTLFEMGIPVVETADKFHVDVQQKVPLNMDRDNVTPAYLRTIRVAVLNATHDRLERSEASATWVKEACSDERVEAAAVRKAIGLRFGDNAVAYDQSDPESNKRSVADGRQVVYGGNLSADEWAQVRRANILPAAGTVTPSDKPYHPDGKELTIIDVADWTGGMHRFAEFAKAVARELMKASVRVVIAREFTWRVMATYGPSGELVINLAAVGHNFFNHGITQEVIDLVIHEYGHHYSGDHLSTEYHDALTRLGAQMTLLALNKPELFR